MFKEIVKLSLDYCKIIQYCFQYYSVAIKIFGNKYINYALPDKPDKTA